MVLWDVGAWGDGGRAEDGLVWCGLCGEMVGGGDGWGGVGCVRCAVCLGMGGR